MSPAAATAGLGVVLALAGAAFASPSLVVPGLALAGLALVAVGWTELAARGAAVIAHRGPGRIVEGDTYPLRVELRRGSVPPLGGEFNDALLDYPVAVGPFRPRRLNVDLRMARRGRHRVGGGTWTIRDPLDLHSRQVAGPPTGELLVLPRIEPVQAAGVGVAGMGSGAMSSGEDGASSIR